MGMGLGFAGGVFNGAMDVQKLQLAQQEQDIRQQAADQAAWKFGQEKNLSDDVQNIAASQTASQQANVDATQQANAALTQNATDVANNGATDSEGHPVQGAPLMKDDGTQATNEDGSLAYQTTQTAPADPAAIKTAYGVKPTAAIAYQSNLQFIQALKRAGQFDQAEKVRTQNDTQAAGAYAAAALSGDDWGAASIHNATLTAHGSSPYASYSTVLKDGEGFPDAKAGDAIIQFANPDGTNSPKQLVPLYKNLTGAAAFMNPTEAFALMKSDRALQAEMQWKAMMYAGQNQRNQTTNETRLITNENTVGGRMLGKGGGAGGSGAGGGGLGGAGSAAAMGDVQAKSLRQYGWTNLNELQDSVSKYVLGSGEKSSDPQTAELIQRTLAYTDALARNQLGTNTSAVDIMGVALNMAKRDQKIALPGDTDDKGQPTPQSASYRPYSYFGQDGIWHGAVKDSAGNAFKLSGAAVDPTSSRYGMSADQVNATEANYYAPVLKQAAADPEAMKQVVAKFGQQKAANLMAAYTKTTTPSAAAPVAANKTPTPIPSGYNEAGYRDFDSTVNGAQRGDKNAAALVRRWLDEGGLTAQQRQIAQQVAG